MKPRFLAVVCLLFAFSAMGQGSVVITFDDLSRDEHLTGQYSSLGVHFADLGGGQPSISVTPAFPSPTGSLVSFAFLCLCLNPPLMHCSFLGLALFAPRLFCVRRRSTAPRNSVKTFLSALLTNLQSGKTPITGMAA